MAIPDTAAASTSARQNNTGVLDVAIIGAGFAGLYMLHRARALGLRARVFERGSDVGGTWFWNRYPGARCDVESLQYSYSFSDELQREWRWTERYATQPEILRYINFVADRLDLRRDISLSSPVTGAVWNETRSHWDVSIGKGEEVEASFLIAAAGCLSASRVPEFPGRETFKGPTYHTGDWPHEPVDFSGKRVGIIGTGSSAIQCIPEVAREAAHLTVFQRTPAFSVPARNRPLTREEIAAWDANYRELRRRAREDTFAGTLMDVPESKALEVPAEKRRDVYQGRWLKGGSNYMLAFTDLFTDLAANETAAEFVRGKIAEIVHDPAVADTLTPRGSPIAAKRLCVDTGYYETFNRPNVTLVDVRIESIVAINERGVQTEKRAFDFDAIIFATGYDAMTGALSRIDIRGKSGLALREKWAAGPHTYLGLMTAGFPNMFMVNAPGSPSVLGNVIMSIEQHVEWISGCLAHMKRSGLDLIEAQPDEERRWTQHVADVAEETIYPKGNSWYLGANVPGKPRIFMPYVGGFNRYRRICNEVASAGYRGFDLRASRSGPPQMLSA